MTIYQSGHARGFDETQIKRACDVGTDKVNAPVVQIAFITAAFDQITQQVGPDLILGRRRVWARAVAKLALPTFAAGCDQGYFRLCAGVAFQGSFPIRPSLNAAGRMGLAVHEILGLLCGAVWQRAVRIQ